MDKHFFQCTLCIFIVCLLLYILPCFSFSHTCSLLVQCSLLFCMLLFFQYLLFVCFGFFNFTFPFTGSGGVLKERGPGKLPRQSWTFRCTAVAATATETMKGNNNNQTSKTKGAVLKIKNTNQKSDSDRIFIYGEKCKWKTGNGIVYCLGCGFGYYFCCCRYCSSSARCINRLIWCIKSAMKYIFNWS